MARPLKNNADWFSHSAQMRNNRKVKALRARFGLEGYAVWCLLLECLTEADKFSIAWSEIEQDLIAGDFGITVEKLIEIITYSQKLGLICIQNGLVFSKNHQSGMNPLLTARENKRQWKAQKKKVSDNENPVRDNENAHSRDRDRDRDRDREENTLKSISLEPQPQKIEIEKIRVETLPDAIAKISEWAKSPQGSEQIEGFRTAAMYSPEKYQDGSIAHQISGFVAHYWKNDGQQARIKADPIGYTLQNFCAWLANAKRMNKPIETHATTTQPVYTPTRPKAPEDAYNLTENQVRQLISQHAAQYGGRFTERHIQTLRMKSSSRAAIDLIQIICKGFEPDGLSPTDARVFNQVFAQA